MLLELASSGARNQRSNAEFSGGNATVKAFSSPRGQFYSASSHPTAEHRIKGTAKDDGMREILEIEGEDESKKRLEIENSPEETHWMESAQHLLQSGDLNCF